MPGEATIDKFNWVDAYLKEAEDLIGFLFNYRGLDAEQKNSFLKKYIKNVTVLDGEITEINYVDEVEKSLVFVTNVTEMKMKVRYDKFTVKTTNEI